MSIDITFLNFEDAKILNMMDVRMCGRERGEGRGGERRGATAGLLRNEIKLELKLCNQLEGAVRRRRTGQVQDRLEG